MTRELVRRARDAAERGAFVVLASRFLNELADELEAAYDFMEAEADRMEGL